MNAWIAVKAEAAPRPEPRPTYFAPGDAPHHHSGSHGVAGTGTGTGTGLTRGAMPPPQLGGEEGPRSAPTLPCQGRCLVRGPARHLGARLPPLSEATTRGGHRGRRDWVNVRGLDSAVGTGEGRPPGAGPAAGTTTRIGASRTEALRRACSSSRGSSPTRTCSRSRSIRGP